MTMNNLEELAARLAQRLAEDIELSKTREEHIRVTARANEAAEVLSQIRALMPARNVSGMGFID